jgi:8-oxo-dGTP diphosphatase
MEPDDELIRAAGAVLWRTGPADGGNPESMQVAVVHRPRYDDWSLPKGKLAPAETELTAAVREVAEETGMQVCVGPLIGQTHYRVATADGSAAKTVSYWSMRAVGGQFDPTDEVDALDWLALDKARARLDFDQDRDVLDAFTRMPIADATIVLVRHARAGKRSEWAKRDELRPLDGAGRRQAGELVGFFDRFRPTRLISADRVRCVQTVQPYADASGLPLEVDPGFNDDAYLLDPAASRDRLLALAAPGQVCVVCGQGVSIPSLIEELAPRRVDVTTRKATAWVLSLRDGSVVAADRYDDAAGPRNAR